MKPKILLIGSTINPVHIKSFYNLIKPICEDIYIIGSHPVDFAPHTCVSFSTKNIFSVIKSIRKIQQVFKEFNPDIIHVHQANSIGFITSIANFRKKYKQVLTTWGDDVLVLPKKNLFYKTLSYVSLAKSDIITADAKCMADAIYDFYGKKKEVTIANFGIDFSVNFEKRTKEKVIYSNRLHDSLYNIDLIITGCATFLSQNPDWKLIIGAKGNLTDKLKELARNNINSDQVEFIGFVDSDTNKNWYLKSTIYISIPSTDGTSISLLEAMGYGCIPIVSDLPANKEWIIDNKNGVIVQNRNNLNIYIKNALKLDLEDVMNQNENIILKRATKDSNRKIFEEIYAKLLK